jgi:hypothetical protein
VEQLKAVSKQDAMHLLPRHLEGAICSKRGSHDRREADLTASLLQHRHQIGLLKACGLPSRPPSVLPLPAKDHSAIPF